MIEQEKRGPGRPKKEVEKDFNDLSEPEMILYLYKNGWTDSQVCGDLQMTKEEFDERFKTDTEFARWISYGRMLCRAWWENKYRDSAEGVKLNAPMVNFAMKNLFGWAEKSEMALDDLRLIEGLSRDEAEQKLREMGPRIADIIDLRPKKAG